MDSSELLHQRLDSLDAYLSSLEEGPDAGLARLRGRSDPESARRIISILLDAHRFRDAADLAHHLPPHKRWCDKAVYALAQDGDISTAKELIAWSRSETDETTSDRCALAYAEARYEQVGDSLKSRKGLLPGLLAPQEELDLRDVLSVLRQLTDPIKAKERVRTELEVVAASIAISIHVLLHEDEDAAALGKLLLRREPLPIVVAELAVRGQIEVSGDLLVRLRTERPGDFQAQFLAIRIEAERLGKPAEAFDAATRLASEVSGHDERNEVCRLLYVIAYELGEDALARVDQLAPALIEEDDPFLKLLRAGRLLDQSHIEDAGVILEEIRDEDDPVWLQGYATFLRRRGENQLAAEYQRKASELLPHPDLLRLTAAEALQYGRLTDAVDALEKVLLRDPQDVASRANLAFIYTQLANFEDAAKHLGTLRQIEPGEVSHGVNYAVALAQSGNLAESLQVYDAVCQTADPPLEAVRGRAFVLKTMGRPHEAFSSLMEKKAAFWDQPDYVLGLLDLAFAAQEEAAGHEALLRLRQLQREGKADPDVLRETTLDEYAEHLKEQQIQCDALQDKIRQGQFPWLFAEAAVGHVAYWGWAVRTQAFRWLFDDPANRARYTIYATNGFTAVAGEDGTRQLEPIECPARGTTIAADLSALITLHQLNLLPQAATYFGKVLIPSAFIAHAVAESPKLMLPQLSRKTGLEEIRSALDAGCISEWGTDVPMPRVDEYATDDTTHYYRLKDIADALHRVGRLSDAQLHDLLKVAHQPSGEGTEHPALKLGDAVLFGLSTLRTLSQSRVLDRVLEAFRVRMTSEDRNRVYAELQGLLNQDRLHQSHMELWESIRQNERFVQTPSVAPQEPEAETGESDHRIFLSALLLAQHTGAPLLADDRVLQAVMLNARPSDPQASFGTDRLLLELRNAELLTDERLADAFLKLVGWRYRFIVFPPEVLKTLALRFSAHPPGQDLREVVLYVHDCMRDAGLFSGWEPTEPPTTLAIRLFRSWIGVIAEFVMEVWADERFSAESARDLTEWAVQEFLPSPPKGMQQITPTVGALAAQMTLAHAMLRSCQLSGISRANAGLRAIADAFGMNEQAYLREVAEVIDDF